MKLDHLVADKLFIDFAGKPLHYIDRLTGELIPCQVFVATLPFSGYSFALAVPSQRVDDLIYALRCCLWEIGGSIVGKNAFWRLKSICLPPSLNRTLK